MSTVQVLKLLPRLRATVRDVTCPECQAVYDLLPSTAMFLCENCETILYLVGNRVGGDLRKQACGYCGRKMAADHDVKLGSCPNCGTLADQAKTKCESCAVDLPVDARFCMGCNAPSSKTAPLVLSPQMMIRLLIKASIDEIMTAENSRQVECMLALDEKGLYSDAVSRIRAAESQLDTNGVKVESDLSAMLNNRVLDFVCVELIEFIRRGGQASLVAQQIRTADSIFAGVLSSAHTFVRSDAQCALDIKLINIIQDAYLHSRKRLAAALRDAGSKEDVPDVIPLSFGKYPKKVKRGIIGDPDALVRTIQVLRREPYPPAVAASEQ